MRYQYFTQFFTTAALAGAMTLLAAPQADTSNYQDPENSDPAVQQSTMVANETAQPGISDRHMQRKIEKAMHRDVTLSNRALDVRVICRNGQVTLKGSVPTTMEKDKIEAKAMAVAGSGNVIDQIRVKHPHNLG
jgi:osmotically-inducible protein OsmY